MSLKQNLNFFIRALASNGQKKTCPYCDHTKFLEIDRKYLVYSLLKCENCGLNHRHPKDDEAWLRKFYQKQYSIQTHMMTQFPSDEEIVKLKQENFPSLRSFDKYIKALFKPQDKSQLYKIIDYGCSWGYNVYQLVQSGYDAVGYELSVPRAEFGEKKLGVSIFSDLSLLPGENDLILSSHVIEHLNDIEAFISFSKSHLNEQGIFMAFCPNGSNEYRKREPETWHGSWGTFHVNCLDIPFAKNAFKDNPYLILTGDWEFIPSQIADWDGMSQRVGPILDGKELLIIAKPNIKIKKDQHAIH